MVGLQALDFILIWTAVIGASVWTLYRIHKRVENRPGADLGLILIMTALLLLGVGLTVI